MPTKKDLEEKIINMKRENESLTRQVEKIKKEHEKYNNFVATLGFVIQEIYRCYPYVIGECCTEEELLRLFNIQGQLSDIIEKLQERKKKKDGDLDAI